MAIFKPIKCLSTELDSLAIIEGQFIATTDTNKIYIDIDNTTRQEYNKDVNLTGYATEEWVNNKVNTILTEIETALKEV